MWEPGVVASLLTVWSHIKPRSRERGGRTPPQKGGNRCKLPTTPDRAVCPSGSRFRSIAKDLESLREMPSFALSRRQHGFESRWGYKIKVNLTRSNAPHANRQPQIQPELWERAGSGTAAAAAHNIVRHQPLRVPLVVSFGSVPRARAHLAPSTRSPVDPAERSQRLGARCDPCVDGSPVATNSSSIIPASAPRSSPSSDRRVGSSGRASTPAVGRCGFPCPHCEQRGQARVAVTPSRSRHILATPAASSESTPEPN